MANFGTRLAYPTPTPRSTAAATPRAARTSDAPRASRFARARRSLGRLVGLWATGLVRGAEPSSLPGWAAPTTYLPGRPATDTGAGGR